MAATIAWPPPAELHGCCKPCCWSRVTEEKIIGLFIFSPQKNFKMRSQFGLKSWSEDTLKMCHFVGKRWESRGVGIRRTVGCAASCLPLGLPVLPEQTTCFCTPIEVPAGDRKQEKFFGFTFRFLWVYSEGSFLNISEKNLGVKGRSGEIFKWHLNNQVSSPSSVLQILPGNYK